MFNGLRGKVYKLEKDKPPIIDFGGKIVTLERSKFEIYDSIQYKTLAIRTQYPVILAYAMTVHRAQGQTLEFVEVDCKSFFAPGQMGVAVGRAKRKAGLRILNFNEWAACLKHNNLVYEFYNKVSVEPMEDISCCQTSVCEPCVSHLTEDTPDQEEALETLETVQIQLQVQDEHMQDEHVECPFEIKNFIALNDGSTFLSAIPPEKFQSLEFQNHVKFLYSKVLQICACEKTTSQQWNDAYSKLNNFILSDSHINQICRLFQCSKITKDQNKLSTRLVFWIMDSEIKRKTDQIKDSQFESYVETSQYSTELTSVGKGKLRYVAGCCIHKIKKRFCHSVLRNLGKCDPKSKSIRSQAYSKQAIMKTFCINESDIPHGDESLHEIDYKQGKSRGLLIVSDEVFNFFILLNKVVQSHLTKEAFHLNFDTFHVTCRNIVNSDEELLESWASLFGELNDNEIEDEIMLSIIMDLFEDVTGHFLKISIADALKKFKETVPRKKKQSLRSKLQALGDRNQKTATSSATTSSATTLSATTSSATTFSATEVARVESGESEYVCKVCNKLCEEEPSDLENQSIGCDKCDLWFHYKCAGVQGHEPFLKSKRVRWYCSYCSKITKKGKEKGKNKPQ